MRCSNSRLEPEDLVDEDDGDPARDDLPVDDEDLVDAAVDAVGRLGAGVLEREGVLLDPAETLIEVRHDLLRADHEDHLPGPADVWTELAATHGGRDQRSGLGHRVDAAKHDVRGRREASDLVGLGRSIHAPDLRPKGVVPAGLLDLVGDPGSLECLRCAVVDLGPVRDDRQHDPLRVGGVPGPEDADSIGFERRRCSLDAGFVGEGAEPTADGPIQTGSEFRDHWWVSFAGLRCYACNCKYLTPTWLHMQVLSEPDVAAALDKLVTDALPDRRGLAAWSSLLRAHATLVRQLETDLEKETDLALADFDVLAQLALAGGELRMTDLAAQALISRSGMTRRVARLVDEGVVSRSGANGDGRGVVVAITDAGLDRLRETAPVHVRGIAQLFAARLDDRELEVLEHALDKVTIVDCSFG
jgi:DNA-binding MarR family transcriptional regulator